MTARYTATMAMLALLAACTPERDAKLEAARAYIRETQGEEMAASAGGLRVTTNDLTTDGRVAKVRGRVENRFEEPVYGIRYVVTIYEYGEPLRVVDRWQHEVDTTLQPGQRSMMRLDVESMYFGRRGSSPFTIEAQPVKLGDKEMPLPEGWR
jgi:hypothetical protein